MSAAGHSDLGPHRPPSPLVVAWLRCLRADLVLRLARNTSAEWAACQDYNAAATHRRETLEAATPADLTDAQRVLDALLAQVEGSP